MPELYITPSATDDTGLFQRFLKAAEPGDTILVADGVYPRQYVTGRAFPRRVTIRGQSRTGVVVESMTVTDLRGVAFENFTVKAKADSWGIQHRGGGQVAYRRLTLDGNATATPLGRGFTIIGDGPDPAKHPEDVVIERCNVFGFYSDLVNVQGGRQVQIVRNALHDLQLNDEHNDGVQILKADDFRIERNLIWCAPGIPVPSVAPDQGIIVSTTGTDTITRGVIAGNRVRNWPGTGIIASGAGVSDVQIYGNEILAAKGGVKVLTVGLRVDDWANTYQSTGPAPPFALDDS